MRFCTAILLLLALPACKPEQKPVRIDWQTPLTGIPSASGMELLEDTLYVCGDDSPWLFTVDSSGKVLGKTPLLSGDFVTISRIPKSEKPDFESMARTEKNELLLFASGSSEKRNTLRIKDPDTGKIREVDLTALYRHICFSTGIKRNRLNIEGACCSKEKLYLLNREDNRVFELNLQAFMHWFKQAGKLPEVRSYRLDLPKIEGISAGLSGACLVPGTTRVFFTASVEDKPDAIRDGEVKGSFVGTFDLVALRDGMKPECRVICGEAGIVALKAESVIARREGEKTKLWIVTDSDDGLSELLGLDWQEL